MSFENTTVLEVGTQRKINYAGLAIAILAAILAVVGIIMASSADDHAGAVGKRVTKVVAQSDDFNKNTVDTINAMRVELSADATALTVLNGKVAGLESKSVVAALAEELRAGKASKVSVDVLRSEMFDKADKVTVRRLARRLGKFDKRINNIVELNKLIEVSPSADQPAADQPPPSPAPAAPAPQPKPLGSVGGKQETPVKSPAAPPAK